MNTDKPIKSLRLSDIHNGRISVGKIVGKPLVHYSDYQHVIWNVIWNGFLCGR